jgi:hypothetical protein
MRALSNTFTALGLAALLITTVFTSGCEFTKKVIAKDKLNQGAIAYNGGKAKLAEGYFKDATDLVPTNSVAWLYLGATVYKRFQNSFGDERKKLGQESLDIFQKALDLSKDCKTRDSALGYISSIYSDLDDTDNNVAWMLKRADGDCADKATKAVTYYSVAVKKWQCSNTQTNRYSDKANKDPFHYRNMDYPAALADKEKATKCTNDGMQYIEKSLAENPDSPDTYFYKGLFYRELQYLTKDDAKRKEYGVQAQKFSDQGVALNKKREEEAKAAEAAAAAAAASPK